MTRRTTWSRILTLAAAGIVMSGCAPKNSEPTDSSSAPAAVANPEAVPTVTTITCAINKSSPPQLVVDVTGEVPTGGWTSPTLEPRVYTNPPADGIWDYDFKAIRPTGMVTQVITPITGSHTWADYPATTLKGVRVHGVGAGVKQATLDECMRR